MSRAQACVATDNYPSPTDLHRKGNSTPIVVLAFGTSLMWGDGLLESKTFRYQIADWIADHSNRQVKLVTFAHSAAMLNSPPPGAPIEPNPAPEIGDLNSSLPSVDEQIRCAASMSELRGASLVLIEGCINEVGAESIVYPWTLTETLKKETDNDCGAPMLTELKSVRLQFPSSVVIVVGYYPLVSERSSIFGFSGTRRLAKHATKAYVAKHPAVQLQSKRQKTRKEENSIMVVNSEAFYQHSKAALAQAVVDANGPGPTTFFLASLPETRVGNGLPTIDPSFAYGAPERHEWMVSFRFLHFWAFYKDQTYWYRQSLCDKYEQDLLARSVCQVNPAFHPNVAGATAYAKSIEQLIPGELLAR